MKFHIVAFFYFVIVILLSGCSLFVNDSQPTPEEKKLFITWKDIPELDSSLYKQTEKWSKKNIFSNTYSQINYNYEAKVHDTTFFYISEQIILNNSPTFAKGTFRGMQKGIAELIKTDTSYVYDTLKNFSKIGDSSIMFAVKRKGVQVGNQFSCLNNKSCLLLLILGKSWNSPEEWSAFIKPRMEELVKKMKH